MLPEKEGNYDIKQAIKKRVIIRKTQHESPPPKTVPLMKTYVPPPPYTERQDHH